MSINRSDPPSTLSDSSKPYLGHSVRYCRAPRCTATQSRASARGACGVSFEQHVLQHDQLLVVASSCADIGGVGGPDVDRHEAVDAVLHSVDHAGPVRREIQRRSLRRRRGLNLHRLVPIEIRHHFRQRWLPCLAELFHEPLHRHAQGQREATTRNLRQRLGPIAADAALRAYTDAIAEPTRNLDVDADTQPAVDISSRPMTSANHNES